LDKFAELKSQEPRHSSSPRGRVPRLRCLQVDVSRADLQLKKQLSFRLGSPEELTLDGKDMSFPFDILEIYGETLTSLRVHAPEPYDPERRPDILLVDLQRLNAICPKLKRFGVDMNRDGQWTSLLSLYISDSWRTLLLSSDHSIVSTNNPVLRLPQRTRSIPRANPPHTHSGRQTRLLRARPPTHRQSIYQIPV
jgi:hypothetical protein